MRITSIRNKAGSKLSSEEMTQLVSDLKNSIDAMGFETNVYQVNSTSIHLGMHMCSFRIIPQRLGYNARANRCTITSCKTGYKRTTTPTWTQREEFNHAVNNILDSWKLTATIRSGEYSIRTSKGRINQWDMPQPFHNGFGLQVPSVLEVVPMKYAKDAVEWVGVNAPFIGAVPEQKPRGLRRSKANSRLLKTA